MSKKASRPVQVIIDRETQMRVDAMLDDLQTATIEATEKLRALVTVIEVQPDSSEIDGHTLRTLFRLVGDQVKALDAIIQGFDNVILKRLVK